MEKPFISICIPAYKNKEFLGRLLDSIRIQDFKDFEVVVSDDSPDESLEELIAAYSDFFKVYYLKNDQPLGSPANWNNAISYAKGKWIKLMHDDDWFVDNSSLGKFAEKAKSENLSLIFSGFYKVNANTLKRTKEVIAFWDKAFLRRNPVYLLRKNYVGHPSTTLILNEKTKWYDERYKWVVDIEFYIRKFRLNKRYIIIDEPLVNLGINDQQITSSVFRKPEVEIPENISLLNDISPASLRNIFAYDYYWRFIRNLSVRNTSIISKYCSNIEVPRILYFMIKQQAYLPLSMIRIGLISKTAMFLTYLWNSLNGRIK